MAKDDERDGFLKGDKYYGTEARKLYRTGDPSTSREAAESIEAETTRLERKVHQIIASFGKRGCISDEVRAEFDPPISYSSVTARYSALEKKRFIVRGPDRRPGDSGRGQMVMRDTSVVRD